MGGLVDGVPFESFYQQESLHQRIKNILAEYPAGLGPLKEFLQNADDAGASEFTLVLDERRHGTDTGRMVAPGVHTHQGRPALLVCNNAVFSDGDFKSITSLGQSGKLTDSTKIGKYGLGFNVSYHYTDVVQFVSRDQLVIFDPQQRCLPESLPGVRLNFVESALSRRAPHQVMPFTGPLGAGAELLSQFLGRMEAPLDGTVFRLALRTEEEAGASLVCSEHHTAAGILELLTEFAAEASSMMVFLRHILRVSMLRITEEGDVTLLATVDQSAPPAPPAPGPDRVGPTRPGMTIAPPRILRQTTVLHDGTGGAGACAGRRDEEWLVVGATAEEDACGLPAGAAAALGSRLEGAVALPITDDIRMDGTGGAGGAAAWTGHVLERWFKSRQPDESGAPLLTSRSHAYCYLPLPIHTGLPAHVHATFAVGSNRRSLWLDDDATARADAKNVTSSDNSSLKAAWNHALLSGVVGPLIAHALHHAAAAGLIVPSAVAQHWPAAGAAVKAPFDVAARAFAKEVSVAGLSVLWAAGADAGPGAGSLARLGDVSFVPASDSGVAPAMMGPLRAIGAANVVSPAAVTSLLDSAGVEYNVLCNASVRTALLKHWAGIGHGVIPFETVNGVLRFMLRQWDPTSGQDGPNGAILRSLAGLPLIPLAHGTPSMGVLGRIGPRVPVHYLVSADYQDLFRGCGRLVDTRGGEWALAGLVGDAKTLLNIKRLGPATLAKIGPSLVLPSDWASHDAVPARAGQITGGTAQDEALIKDYRKQMAAASKATKKPAAGKAKGQKGRSAVRVDNDWMDDVPIDGEDWAAHGDEDTGEPAIEPPPLIVPFRLELAGVTLHLHRLWTWLAHSGATERDIQPLVGARWPLIPTSAGMAVSVPYARLRGVLPPGIFDGATASVLGDFGCLFADLPSDGPTRALWSHKAVGIVQSNLLHALYDGVTAGGPRDTAGCKGLRDSILGIAKDPFRRAACLSDPSALRALPIFRAVGPAETYVPADRTVSASPAPEWDPHLARAFPGEILEIEGDDAEMLLGLAEIHPRGKGRPDVATFLDVFLLPRLVAGGAGAVLGQELCLLVLQAIGRLKWWTRPDLRLMDAVRSSPIVCADGAGGPRRRCDQTFNPRDPMMVELGRTMDLESILGAEGPPAAYQDDPDVMKAMAHLGMPGLAAPAVFLRVAEEVERGGDMAEARVLMSMLARIHDSSSPVRTVPGWSDEDFSRLGAMKVFIGYRAQGCAVLPRLLGEAMSRKDTELFLAACGVKTATVPSGRGRRGGRKTAGRPAADDDAGCDDGEGGDGTVMGLRPGNVRKALEAAAEAMRTARPANDSGRSDGDVLSAIPQVLLSPLEGGPHGGPVMPGADALASWSVLPVVTPLLSHVCPRALRLMGLLPLAGRVPRPGHKAIPTTIAHLGNICTSPDPAPPALLRAYAVHALAATVATHWTSPGTRPVMSALAQARWIVLDDGQKLGPCDVVLDADDGFGGRRALPGQYEALEPMLAALGALNIASRGQPTVEARPLPDLGAAGMAFFRSQFNKAEFADAALVDPADPAQAVFVHRLMLAWVSPALATVLAARHGSKGLSSATLPDYPHISVMEVPSHIGIDAARLLVDAIYNGPTVLEGLDSQPATSESLSLVCGLLRVSDLYLVAAVREWCEAWIAGKEVIQTHNVLALYALAKETSARQLMRVCQYHVQQLAPALMVTDEWAALTPAEQAEVMGNRRRKPN